MELAQAGDRHRRAAEPPGVAVAAQHRRTAVRAGADDLGRQRSEGGEDRDRVGIVGRRTAHRRTPAVMLIRRATARAAVPDVAHQAAGLAPLALAQREPRLVGQVGDVEQLALERLAGERAALRSGPA